MTSVALAKPGAFFAKRERSPSPSFFGSVVAVRKTRDIEYNNECALLERVLMTRVSVILNGVEALTLNSA